LGPGAGDGLDRCPRLRERGINLSMVNMGGGFRTKYLKDVPPVVQYGRSIFRALRSIRQPDPETIIEPGRGMVRNAGMIETEVVLISRKSDEDEGALGVSRHRQVAVSPRRWTSRSATPSDPA